MSPSDYFGGFLFFGIIIGVIAAIPALLAALFYYSSNKSAWQRALLDQSSAQGATAAWAVAIPILVFFFSAAIPFEEKIMVMTFISLSGCSLVSSGLMYWAWKTIRGPLFLGLTSTVLVAASWALLELTRSPHGQVSILYSALALLGSASIWCASNAYALELCIQDRTVRNSDEY